MNRHSHHPCSEFARFVAACLACVLVADDCAADELPSPPVLRLDPHGPIGFVSGLAFHTSPEDGALLLRAASFDKTLHTWVLHADGQFRYSSRRSLRAPIGPGLYGSLNAVAVSTDGTWVAVGGRSPIRGAAGHDEAGLMLPSAALSDDAQRDLGVVHVWNGITGTWVALRGHTGTVQALAFVHDDARSTHPPRLVSAALGANNSSPSELRLWDVSTATELARLTSLPAQAPARAGLAARQNGATARDVLAVATWSDQTERVWDVAAEQFRTRRTAALYCAANVSHPQPNLLVGGAGALTAAAAPAVSWLTPERTQCAAVAATEVRRPNGAPLLAWVCATSARTSMQLVLQTLDAPRVLTTAPLWSGARLPALAASPDGAWLAVAGNPEHHVWLFSLSDLLEGRRQPRVLRSAAAIVEQAGFVKRGNDWGVSFTVPGVPPSPGQRLVFDATRRLVVPHAAEWTLADAPAGDWTLANAKAADGSVELRSRDGRRVVLRGVPSTAEVTAFCMGPLRSKAPRWVALATMLQAEPRLSLFDAATGRAVRELTGHEARISALAFSNDGRLLLSTGHDRQIAVWWLPDLDDATLAPGALPQIVASPVAGSQNLRVDASTHPLLKVGDLLVAWRSRDGQAVAWTSPFEFYRTIADLPPGHDLTFQVRPAGGGPLQDVTVTLDRGADERKPLASLFLADAGGTSHHWMAWDPQGRYDTGSDDAEAFLGWQFHTGQPESPVRFASAGEYREQARWPGLLRDHLQDGPRIRRPVPAPPRLSLLLKVVGDEQLPGRSDRGEAVVRARAVAGWLAIAEFPVSQIASVEWRRDDGEWLAAVPQGDAAWSFTSELTVPRQRSQFQVRVTTRETPPREFTAQDAVRWIPAPPVVTIAPEPPRRLESDELVWSVASSATVQSPVRLLVVHRTAGAVVTREEWQSENDAARTFSWRLKPGRHRVEVIATPVLAVGDAQHLERTERAFEVLVSDPQRPEIAELKLRRASDAAFVPAAAVSPAGRVEIDERTVELHGVVRIAEPERLQSAAVRLDAGDPRPMPNWPDQPTNVVSFRVPLTLSPGRQTVRLTATSQRRQTAEESLELVFRPALPELLRLRLVAAGADEPLPETLISGRDAVNVELVADLPAIPLARFAPHRITARLLRDRSDGLHTEEFQFSADTRPGTLRQPLALHSGRERIWLELSNEWGVSRRTEPISVEVRSPPEITDVQVPETTHSAQVDFSARVRSPFAVTSVDLRVNDIPVATDRIRVTEGSARGEWTIAATLALDSAAGLNRVSLRAANRDGISLQAIERNIECAPPAAAPPRIVTRPSLLTVVADPEFEWLIEVQSERKPSRVVALHTAGDLVREIAAEPIEAASNTLTPRWAAAVLLEPGVNLLQAQVETDRGTARGALTTVVLVPPPVALDVTRLEPDVGPPLLLRGQRLHRTAASPSSQVTVHGRVLALSRTASTARVKVWVNGFLQSTVAAGADGAFVAPVVLNRPQGNRIQFELPGRPVDAALMPELQIDCERPIPPGRLHLVVLGAALNENEHLADLQARALAALGERSTGGGPPYKIVAYPADPHRPGALSRDFTPEQVNGLLLHLADVMHGGRGPVNDIVLIYYRGREWQNAAGEFELQAGNPRMSLKQRTLAQRLAGIPGAHLVLLDVEHPPTTSADAWPADGNLGVIRLAWRGATPPREDETLLPSVAVTLNRPDPPVKDLAYVGHSIQQLRTGAKPRAVFVSTVIPEPLGGLVLHRRD